MSRSKTRRPQTARAGPEPWRRVRLLRLQAAVAWADRLAEAMRGSGGWASAAWRGEAAGEGISVIIPERGTPDLLDRCLGAATAAAARLEEPSEILVVASGSAPADYLPLASRLPAVSWSHSVAPLTFAEAIGRGLRRVRHPWVYLLNSDMFLEPDALQEAARWLAPEVFAVASQICPEDEHARREETGWTDLRIVDGLVEIFDAEPDDETTTRGALYAGGGSSLFRRDLLRRFIVGSAAYAPFYWEDVEWGALAWGLGFETLFCPRSRARHVRRATAARHFPAAEIERVFGRNALQFQLRNLRELGSLESLWSRILVSDQRTFAELTRWRTVARAFRSRLGRLRLWSGDSALSDAAHRYYLRRPDTLRDRRRLAPFRSRLRSSSLIRTGVIRAAGERSHLTGAFPDVTAQEAVERLVALVVTPFAVHPAAHGGAVRMSRLIEGLCTRFNVVLLSDEREAYPKGSARRLANLSAVHLVGGRSNTDGLPGICERMEAHCHERLRREMARLLRTARPSLVQVEYMELAPLVEFKEEGTPWSLMLHDVTAGTGCPEDELRQADLLRQYDFVFVCSSEDAALVPQCRPVVVPNGCDPIEYVPSARDGPPALLFAGPFRYAPNLEGIRAFLAGTFQRLREQVPGVELWILGGEGAMEKVLDQPACFDQAGVTVYDRVDDVLPFLRACTATINPVTGTRGSSVKLLESVAAGRACVSTREGARGFLEAGFPSLVTVDTVGGFLEPLARLLKDAEYRHGIEAAPEEQLRPYRWDASVRRLLEAYERGTGRS